MKAVCEGCGERVPVFREGLCQACFWDWDLADDL
jgi:NMD protein affecting ribosome stability and mRNA decay